MPATLIYGILATIAAVATPVEDRPAAAADGWNPSVRAAVSVANGTSARRHDVTTADADLSPGAAADERRGFAGVRGASSCSYSSCHGGDPERGRIGSEFATFKTRDPHARAYRVLFTAESKYMTERLNEPAPERNLRCLRCHVARELEPADIDPFRHRLTEGVSCESCHGPSAGWVGEHHLDAFKTTRSGPESGFRDLANLAVRARLCTDCHVGSARAEVDHDLIAAGHPPLRFEFAAYHAIYRDRFGHWPSQRDRERDTDVELRAWVLGRREARAATIETLAARIEREARPARPIPPKDERVPVAGRGSAGPSTSAAHRGDPSAWIDLAGFDCASCHRRLSGPDERGRMKLSLASRRSAGTWGSWTGGLPMMGVLPGESAAEADRWNRLQTEMNRASPDVTLVRELLRGGSRPPAEAESLIGFDPTLVGAALARSRRELAIGPDANLGWDRSAHAFLGLAALHARELDRTGPEANRAERARLEQLRRRLLEAFPPSKGGYPVPALIPDAGLRSLLGDAGAP